MTPALDTMPRTELTGPQEIRGGDRPSLADLAQLGAEELSARIRRALPDTGAGAVPVAAFNSSI
ncbi:FxSxx-COOH cyclophane-containing RiPP peptide [Streptomyces sp. NRRL S-350]|uniref:FxSxx-COOH cyclophane-containing RiPP peptide n=1 Tax=Streptomyces sp. NRRL S-350 TaxID=1463902 RepID=UPI0004C1A9DC|nr:FxSxx-COOH cyclophane-containing RiPP peptide [Streptomyces sp. NRRL S-350]